MSKSTEDTKGGFLPELDKPLLYLALTCSAYTAELVEHRGGKLSDDDPFFKERLMEAKSDIGNLIAQQRTQLLDELESGLPKRLSKEMAVYRYGWVGEEHSAHNRALDQVKQLITKLRSK